MIYRTLFGFQRRGSAVIQFQVTVLRRLFTEVCVFISSPKALPIIQLGVKSEGSAGCKHEAFSKLGIISDHSLAQMHITASELCVTPGLCTETLKYQ